MLDGCQNVKKKKVSRSKRDVESSPVDQSHDECVDVEETVEEEDLSSSDDSNIDNEIEIIKSRLKTARKEAEIDSGSDLDFDFPAVGEEFDEDEDDDEGSGLFKGDQTGDGYSDKSKDRAGTSDKNNRKTEVDDQFFKLSEMETFLEDEDAKEMKRIRKEESGSRQEDESDEEDIDMFGGLSNDENDKVRTIKS